MRDAEIKVEKALREYQRGLTLRNQNVISEKDLQDYKTALDETETSRNTVTRNQLQQWYAGEVAKETDLDNLEAEKHQLAEEEELYSIVAPVDGTVIGLVGLTVGSYVRAAQELGEISPLDNLLVEAYVSPTDIGQLYIALYWAAGKLSDRRLSLHRMGSASWKGETYLGRLYSSPKSAGGFQSHCPAAQVSTPTP